MKLSIWQQFSSNHSTSFTVVGRFETQAEADSAAGKFREILRAIHAWRSAPGNLEEWYRQQNEDPGASVFSPLEQAFAAQYEVKWGWAPIDWTGNNPDERVQQFDRDVFVTTEYETWAPPTPIEELMVIFGGSVFTQLMEGIDLVVHLTALMPDALQAQQIVDEASKFTWDYRQKARKAGTLSLKTGAPWGANPGAMSYLNGMFRREGSHVLYDGRFFHVPELLKVIDWLKQRGATDITYTLTENSDDYPGFRRAKS